MYRKGYVKYTSTAPPSTTPDINATNCPTETSPKKDVKVADIDEDQYILYWFFSMHPIYFFRKWKPDGSRDTSEIR